MAIDEADLDRLEKWLHGPYLLTINDRNELFCLARAGLRAEESSTVAQLQERPNWPVFSDPPPQKAIISVADLQSLVQKLDKAEAEVERLRAFIQSIADDEHFGKGKEARGAAYHVRRHALQARSILKSKESEHGKA